MHEERAEQAGAFLSGPWQELLGQVLTSLVQTTLGKKEPEMSTLTHYPWNFINILFTEINSIMMHSGSSPPRLSSTYFFHTLIAADFVFSIIFLFFPSMHLKAPSLPVFWLRDGFLLKGQWQIRAVPACTLAFSWCCSPQWHLSQ